MTPCLHDLPAGRAVDVPGVRQASRQARGGCVRVPGVASEIAAVGAGERVPCALAHRLRDGLARSLAPWSRRFPFQTQTVKRDIYGIVQYKV